jgi:hypothetical protein
MASVIIIYIYVPSAGSLNAPTTVIKSRMDPQYATAKSSPISTVNTTILRTDYILDGPYGRITSLMVYIVHLICLFTSAQANVNSVIRPEQPVLRLHEGFIGLPTEIFHFILDDWVHTIKINLPSKPTTNDLRSISVELTNTVSDTPFLFDKNQGRYLYDFDCKNCSHCDLTRTLSNYITLFKYQNA